MMIFSDLLGKDLKSDKISQLLDLYDLETIYDFDRNNENIEDTYWVSAKKQGFLLRFDKNQVLDTIFLYVVESEGFASIAASEVDVEMPKSLDEAKLYFERTGIRYEFRNGVQTILGKKWWIRGNLGNFSLHYEYKNDQLFRITLMKNN